MKTHKLLTLVLNADYLPHRVVDWRDAFIMIYAKGECAAHISATYDVVVMDSMGRKYNVPSVIVLNEYVKSNNKIATYSKKAIYLRDKYTCQYCNGKFLPDRCNIDHVVPKSRSQLLPKGIKLHSFENCVTACIQCNSKKDDKTLKESGMKLLRQPRPITKSQKIWLDITSRKYPVSWEPYLQGIAFNE